jgi:Uma2 family endonuclease
MKEVGRVNLNSFVDWCETKRDLLHPGIYKADYGRILLPIGYQVTLDKPPKYIRSPDASWVRRERWQALTPEQRRGFVPLCPDFVVELRSSSDSLTKLQEKMQEYLENGARLGWLINPQNQQVEIYRPGQEVDILEHPTELSAENLLPGFILNLRRIWR